MMRMTFRNCLIASAVGAALLCAPALYSEHSMAAYAQAKRKLWVKDFESNYAKWVKTLDTKISKNKVYPADIKRAKEALSHAIEGLTRDGHDPAPYQERMDAFFISVDERVEAAALQGRRKAISKMIPAIKPGPGVESVSQGEPTWCGDIVAKMSQARRTAPFALGMPTYASGITIKDVQVAALMACSDPFFPAIQQWSQAYRQHVSNLTGFSRAQNDALMEFASRSYTVPLDEGVQGRPKFGPVVPRCAKHPPQSEGPAEAQVNRDLERVLLGCKGEAKIDNELKLNLSFPDQSYPYWAIDTQTGPTTELARAGLVKNLLLHRVASNALYDVRAIKNPDILLQNFALARTVNMDLTALEKEITSLGLGEEIEWELRFRGYEVHQAMRKVEAFAMGWLTTHPEYKALLIDGPEASVASYRKEAASSKALLDMILAIEDRIDPENADKLDGCAKSLYSPFSTWLRARAKKDKLASSQDLDFDDYRGSLLLYGLSMCGLNDSSTTGMAQQLISKMNTTLVQRGPLSAAYAGLLSAFNDLQERKSAAATPSATQQADSSSIDLSHLSWSPIRRPDMPQDLVSGANTRIQSGVIKSVKQDGDRVVVYFKSMNFKVPTYICTDTSRISYIENNGIVHYEQRCLKSGTRELTETNDPVSMPAFVADGLKPNMSMTYTAGSGRDESDDGKPGVRDGWPQEVYKSKKQKVLMGLYGVKL